MHSHYAENNRKSATFFSPQSVLKAQQSIDIQRKPPESNGFRGFLIWCGRWDLNPHVYGWTQAPQACLSTDSSTPAYAYALVKRMSYYNRYARNVNHKFSTQVDFFVFLSAGTVWRVSVTRTAVRMASAAMSASAPSAIGSR